MTYPVTVIVPHLGTDARLNFFNEVSLPAICAAEPDEALNYLRTIHGETTGAMRNKGVKRARNKYVLFCDEDMVLKPEIFERMIPAIEKAGADFAFCDYTEVVHKGVDYPDRRGVDRRLGRWNADSVRSGATPRVASLFRRDAVVDNPFDQKIHDYATGFWCLHDLKTEDRNKVLEGMGISRTAGATRENRYFRLDQVWDFWKRLADAGKVGAHVPEILFEDHHIDDAPKVDPVPHPGAGK